MVNQFQYMKELRKYRFVRILLFPISILYGLVTDLRNYLFNHRLLKVHHFSVPVISIGNITSGGTGKTPFTMLLIELLADEFDNIVVISRGYGRKSRGLFVISNGKGDILPVDAGGDEPVMIARKFPRVPVIVAAKRSEGISKAIKLFDANLILLDDAFQHRWVARDCDIVLINGEQSLKSERMLPLGNLRENLRHLTRSDILVITHLKELTDHRNGSFLEGFAPDQIFDCNFFPHALVDAQLRPCGNLELLSGQPASVFAAIAEPARFKQRLLENSVIIQKFKSFPDHHWYSRAEMQKIRQEALQAGCKYLITTEKDLVKLEPSVFTDLHLVGIAQKGVIKDVERFKMNLLRFIDIKI
jgi:tetraacyldisaccharide 4'-kinase